MSIQALVEFRVSPPETLFTETIGPDDGTPEWEEAAHQVVTEWILGDPSVALEHSYDEPDVFIT